MKLSRDWKKRCSKAAAKAPRQVLQERANPQRAAAVKQAPDNNRALDIRQPRAGPDRLSTLSANREQGSRAAARVSAA
jgi:hypothetical protein